MSRRILQGVVVSDAGDKTVVVRVERRVMHPIYKKFIRQSKKYAAHDEQNRWHVGDHGPHRGEPSDFETQALGGAGGAGGEFRPAQCRR